MANIQPFRPIKIATAYGLISHILKLIQKFFFFLLGFILMPRNNTSLSIDIRNNSNKSLKCSIFSQCNLFSDFWNIQ